MKIEKQTLEQKCWFYLVCILAGLFTGFVGGYFQVFLHKADALRLELSGWGHETGWLGFLAILVICFACAAVARFLVRFAPTAEGSGIQFVEAIWRDEVPQERFRIVVVKFFGGLLSLGSGMALGREGPTVQMGAAIGSTFGRLALRFRPLELKCLTMAAAGAGLGVAFSAPLGGAMFTLEEVTEDVKATLSIPTLLCVFAGCSVSMTILGMQPDYMVLDRVFTIPSVLTAIGFILFGIFLGFMGTAYNQIVLLLLNVNAYFEKILPEIKAGIVGIVVALLVWFAPDLTGGGDALAQNMLNYSFPILTIVVIGVIRWIFAPLCYSTGVPGGLFSPLLLMGGILGHLFCWFLNLFGMDLNPLAFCAVGMSAFFASTIQAPVTGVLLILEMTACWDLTLPMILATAFSFATVKVTGCLPIYTLLRLRIPEVKALMAKGVNVLDEPEEV